MTPLPKLGRALSTNIPNRHFGYAHRPGFRACRGPGRRLCSPCSCAGGPRADMRYVSTRGEAPAVGFLDAVLDGLAPTARPLHPRAAAGAVQARRDRRLRRPPLCRARRRGRSAASPASSDRARRPAAPDDAGRLPELHPRRRHAPAPAGARAVAAGAVPRPDPGLQGRGHAGLGAALRTRARGSAGRHRDHIVAATSGDFGGRRSRPSAGRWPMPGWWCCSPHGRISRGPAAGSRSPPPRRRQRGQSRASTGSFDDCQAIVKDPVPATRPCARRRTCPGVNSINIARIATQAVYYFFSALALSGARPAAWSFSVRPPAISAATPSPAMSPGNDGPADRAADHRHQRQ